MNNLIKDKSRDLKQVKEKNNKTLMEYNEVTKRWKEHSRELLSPKR